MTCPSCGGPVPDRERVAYGRCEDCAVSHLPRSANDAASLLSPPVTDALLAYRLRDEGRRRGSGGRGMRRKPLPEE